MKKLKLFSAVIIFCVAIFGLCGCDDGGESGLHIDYDSDSVYGSEDYLGSTITIAGSGVSKETLFTVKELESLAKESEELEYEGYYSMMSRGGEFSYHKYYGIRLYDLLKECGLMESLPLDTMIRFVSVDGYAISIKLSEIEESTDCTYASKTDIVPKEENVPIILAFSSDGIPLTGTVGDMKLGEKVDEDGGYDEKAENEGGPVRLISGQVSSGEFNAPDNVKWLRQIIVGEDDNAKAHADALKDEQAVRSNDTVEVDESKGDWNHSMAPYSRLLGTTLKITGADVNEKTYTLKELEEMQGSTVTDSFGASGGVNGYRGVILRNLIEANLKDGIEVPGKITVVGADGYEAELFVDDVMNGIDSRYQSGEHRDIIIAYAIDGNPLVENKSSDGFKGDNGYGPMRLVVENQMSRWVKNVAEIRVGE